MRKGNLRGYDITFNERDYKQLLNRFDVNKAVRVSNFWKIKVPCICHNYPYCGGCPACKATKSETSGCSLIVNKYFIDTVSLGSFSIWWYPQNNTLVAIKSTT